MHFGIRLLSALLFFFAFLGVGKVYAKEVNLEWKPIKYAIKYEIKMEKDGKPFFKKSLQEPNWSGELGFGLYDYEIRAIDKLDRPGQWSKARPLVVMPASPELVSPSDGDKVTVYDPRSKIKFAWKEVPGITAYKFSLLKQKKVVAELTLKNTQAQLSGLTSGEYQWQVRAVIAGVKNKVWESPVASPLTVEIEQKKLEKPVPSYPVGEIEVTKDKKYKFKWSKVEGASGYVLRLHSLEGRIPAAEKSITLKDATTEIEVPVEGKFKWEVNAVSNLDEKGTLTAVGATSVTRFNIIHPDPFPEGDCSINLSPFYAPLSLSETSPAFNIRGTSHTASTGMRLDGEYYFKHSLGVGLNIQTQSLEVEGQKQSLKNLALTGRYRMQIGKPSNGYFFYPKLGIEERDYVMYLPYSNNNQGLPSQVGASVTTATGPVLGLDFRKQFNDRIGLSAQVEYFYPLALSGGGGTMGTTGLASGAGNHENLNFGIQGTYWITPSISTGLGFYLNFYSLEFNRNSSGNYGGPGSESISMNSQFFLVNVGYSFGK